MDAYSIKLGNVQSLLAIAKRCNIDTHLLKLPSEHEERSHTITSLELIKVSKELSRANEALYKVDNDIHRRLLDQESAKFTHPNILDERVIQLNKLLEYFSEAISNTSKLVARLQKQTVDSTPSLKMDVKCQRQFTELLTTLVKILNNHSVYSNSLKHLREEFKFKNDLSKINKFSEMVHLLVECKETSQLLQDNFQLQTTITS